MSAQIPTSSQILFISERNRESVGFFLVLMNESADSHIQQDWGMKRKLLLVLNGEGKCIIAGQTAGILSEAIPASKLV